MATSRRRERELARRRFERRRQAELERRARAKRRNTVLGAVIGSAAVIVVLALGVGQHFLGRRLGGRQEPGAQAGSGKNRFANFFLPLLTSSGCVSR